MLKNKFHHSEFPSTSRCQGQSCRHNLKWSPTAVQGEVYPGWSCSDFKLFPSARCILPRCRTNRLKHIFVPAAIGLLNDYAIFCIYCYRIVVWLCWLYYKLPFGDNKDILDPWLPHFTSTFTSLLWILTTGTVRWTWNGGHCGHTDLQNSVFSAQKFFVCFC